MVIGLGYVPTIIFDKTHSSNEFISPHSTSKHQLSFEALLCAVIQIWVIALLQYLKICTLYSYNILAAIVITLFTLIHSVVN